MAVGGGLYSPCSYNNQVSEPLIKHLTTGKRGSSKCLPLSPQSVDGLHTLQSQMAFTYICALCTKTKGHQQTKQIRPRQCHIWTRHHDISDYFSSYLEIVTEEESCSLAYNHATLTYCQGNESSKNRFVCDYVEKSTQAIGELLPDPLLQHVSSMNKWKYL